VVLTVFCYFIGHELIYYQRIRSSQDTVLYCTLLHCVYVYFHVHAFIFWHKFVGSARLTVNKSARVLRGCKFDRILPSSERVWRTAPHELDCLHMDCWRICSDMLWGVEEWKRSLTKLWNGSIWSKTFFFKQADDRATLWVFKTKNSFGRNKRGHKITRLVRGQRIQSYVVLKVLSAASP